MRNAITMHLSTNSLLRCAALATVLGLTLSACGGGGGASVIGAPAAVPTGGTLRIPQSPPPPPDFADLNMGNTDTADMPVPRPNTTPCTVTLFTNDQFDNYSYQPYSYTPPAACPGPWAKVVFEGDFNVQAGNQFDRTAVIWFGGATLYYGTTSEPQSNLGPNWHVESDVTDLTPLFLSAQTGNVYLGNTVNSTYTSNYFGTATLQFYPASTSNPVPAVPDAVVAFPNNPGGGQATLNTGTDTMSVTTTFPTNVINAYLDVFLQSQSEDEPWYMCVPTDLFTNSQNAIGECPNSAFREGEVTIDGQPAGVAPIYPWIYTGGQDPTLWSPIPAVQTLNFKPYRVDLSPFAGVLSNGSAHTIAVSVFNADSYFNATGNLYLYLDHGASTVTGALESDTLAAPAPVVSDGVTLAAVSAPTLFGGVGGTGIVDTSMNRSFTIDGYVNTSSGKIDTKIAQTLSFDNNQNIVYNGNVYQQNMAMDSTVQSTTTVAAGSSTTTTTSVSDYPMTESYVIEPDVSPSLAGAALQLPVTITQSYIVQTVTTGAKISSSSVANSISSTSGFIFDQYFDWIGVAPGASQQTYLYQDSTGTCYGKELQSANYLISSIAYPSCTGAATATAHRASVHAQRTVVTGKPLTSVVRLKKFPPRRP